MASVARLWLPFCFCWSYSNANSGCQRGATLAASIRVVCKCLFRCFEIGVLCNLPAELCSAPHKTAIADGSLLRGRKVKNQKRDTFGAQVTCCNVGPERLLKFNEVIDSTG